MGTRCNTIPLTYMKKIINTIQEYSIPLIVGLIVAIVWANLDYESYHHVIEYPLFGDTKIFGYPVTVHFLINDIFMVFFFGVATVEIVQAVSAGGALNPISKSINPLFATAGGILGPVFMFFVLCYVMPLGSLMGDGVTRGDILNGWGIPTATDIALAWMVMKILFGSKHPAVSYLLLLAVIDDAIGLGIIAIFYPDPVKPVQPQYLALVLLAIVVAIVLRKFRVRNYLPYVLLAGGLSWCGLIMSRLHPALALVFVVAFMPYTRDKKSTLTNFEHTFKLPVDIGLFGFALANAGVEFSSINILTLIIVSSLILGKFIGIGGLGMLAHKLGYSLPKGMSCSDLVVLSVVAGLGLTVSLFIAGEAYTNLDLLNGAKMGATFSIFAAPIAFLIYKFFK